VDASDAKPVLEKLRDAVDSKKDSAASGSIWAKVIIALIGIAGVAAFAFVEWRRGRQMAALVHEKTVREVDQANQRIAEANAKDADEAKRAQAASQAATAAALKIDVQIAAMEAQRERDKTSIAAIRSWNDIVGK